MDESGHHLVASSVQGVEEMVSCTPPAMESCLCDEERENGEEELGVGGGN